MAVQACSNVALRGRFDSIAMIQQKVLLMCVCVRLHFFALSCAGYSLSSKGLGASETLYQQSGETVESVRLMRDPKDSAPEHHARSVPSRPSRQGNGAGGGEMPTTAQLLLVRTPEKGMQAQTHTMEIMQMLDVHWFAVLKQD